MKVAWVFESVSTTGSFDRGIARRWFSCTSEEGSSFVRVLEYRTAMYVGRQLSPKFEGKTGQRQLQSQSIDHDYRLLLVGLESLGVVACM